MKTRWAIKVASVVLVMTLPVLGVNVNYYWSGAGDNNEGGDGTWDTTTGHWGTAAPYNQPWNNVTMGADIANFRGTSGTVDVQAAGVVCRRVNVTFSGYWIRGGKITSDAFNNNFVIDKSAANWVRIDNDFDLITNNPATINIRIRNTGGLTAPLVVSGTFQFIHNSGTKYLDIDGAGTSGSRTDFAGSLLDTAGATVRLRLGNNSGHDASVYNLSGSSTYAGGTHVVRGTVNVSSSGALGSSTVQLCTSTT
ncbi:MAG: hypothetical protein N2595_09005, partial [bacterium]|nr:hypothetical protein [bacterium]